MKRLREDSNPGFFPKQKASNDVYPFPPAVLLYSERVGDHVALSAQLEEQAAMLRKAERVDIRLAAISFIVQRVDDIEELDTKRSIFVVAERQLWIEKELPVIEGLVKILCSLAIPSGTAQKSGKNGDDDTMSVEVAWALLRFMTAKEAENSTLKSSVKLHVIRSLCQIGRAGGNLEHRKFGALAKEQLADSNPRLREVGIRLLVQSTRKEDSFENDGEGGIAEFVDRHRAEGVTTTQVLMTFSRDPYPNVRGAALSGILELHRKGFELELGAYKVAVAMLRDTFETVRITAMKLVGVCTKAVVWRNSEISQTKYTDNAFLQICNMITDMAMNVRREASNVLAEMTGVSGSVLLQSLARKVLTKPATEKAPSTGVGSSSVSIIDSSVYNFLEDFKLLDWSTAGAFVIGLEDEFWEVRLAAVSALGKLGKASQTMANGALELLIDMINDSSSNVRKQTIRSLSDLARAGRLSVLDSHLHMFVGILEDPNSEMRRLGHGLLSAIAIPSVNTFRAVIQALFKSLDQHREDEKSLLRTLGALGKSHLTYSEFIANDLVQELQVILNSETGLDEPRCTAILALLLSASTVNGKIISMIPPQLSPLPRVVAKKLPKIEPVLHIVPMGYKTAQYSWCSIDMSASFQGGNKDHPGLWSVLNPTRHDLRNGVTGSLEHLLPRYGNVARGCGSEEIHLHGGKYQSSLAVTVSDRQYTTNVSWEDDNLEAARQIMAGAVDVGASLEIRAFKGGLQKLRIELTAFKGKAVGLGGTLSFCELYLQCLTSLVQLRTHFVSQETRLLVRKSGDPQQVLNRLDSMVKHMLNRFIGFSFEQLLGIIELEVVSCLWKLALNPAVKVHGQGSPIPAVLEQLKATISIADDKLLDKHLPPSLLLRSVEEQILTAERGSQQKLEVHSQQTALQLALSYWPRETPLHSSLREMRAVVSAPGKDFDHPLGFVAGLTLCIAVDVTVYNVPQSFSLWVRFARDRATPAYRYLDVDNNSDLIDKTRHFSALLYLDNMPSVTTSVCRICVVLEGLDCQGTCGGNGLARGPMGPIFPLCVDVEVHLVVIREREKSSKQQLQGKR